MDAAERGADVPARVDDRAALTAGPPSGTGRRGSGRELPARLQPLLLAAGVVLVVPYLVAVAAPWPVLLLAALLVAWGLRIAWQQHNGGLDPQRTARFGQFASTAGAAAYLLLLVVDGGRHPTATLLIAAGIAGTVALHDPPVLRWTIQGVAILGAGAAVALADTWFAGAFVTAVLAVVAVVSNAYAAERLAATARQEGSRLDVDRRTHLLAAIAMLPDDDVVAAARGVVATLRQLGYDAAAVELVREDRLEVVAIDGLPPLPAPRGQGIGWQAIVERRTVTTDHYPRTAWRLPGRRGIHAGTATPIVVDAEAIGCVIGLRVPAAAATTAEIEVIEVLAVHLGAVIRRLEREHWQRAQLEQLDRLRHLHAELAVALGTELRGPLAATRRLGAAVVDADADAGTDAATQEALADAFARRTEDVLRVAETVLEVGKIQVAPGAPVSETVEVGALLAPVVRSTGVEVVFLGLPAGPGVDAGGAPTVGSTDADTRGGRTRVHVVEPFVQRALELLLRSGAQVDGPARSWDGHPQGPARLVVRAVDGCLDVVVERGDLGPTGMARAVAARLLRSAGATLQVDDGGQVSVRLPAAASNDAPGLAEVSA